jgi:hypothetical protein
MGDNKIGFNTIGDGNILRDNTIIIESQKPPDRTSDEPPNNLEARGIDRDRFVGRDDVLQDLHARLQRSERVAIASVAGMGGVGKSELAVQYGRRHLSETYRGGVVWLAGERAGLELLSFARSTFFPTVDFSQFGDLREQLAFCWAHWPANEVPPESVLLIFDDVTDYAAQVKPYLPSDSRFRVVVTTRERLQGISRLDLDVLTPQAALEMLQNIIGEEQLAAEAETASALCQFLGYLPLGIELAGYYVCEEECSLAELLLELEKHKQKVLKHPALKKPEPTMMAQYGVEAAFDLSWKRLDWDARFLGSYIGLFASAPIHWNLVIQRTEVSESVYEALEVARRKLVRFSLLKKLGEYFQYHPLVKHFFLSKLESDEFMIPPSHQLTEGSVGLLKLLGANQEG